MFNGFVRFKIFWNSFFKKYGFLALFLLIFKVKFSFLKSIESMSVVKKCPASAGILFFCLVFWKYKHIIYLVISFFFLRFHFFWEFIFLRFHFLNIFLTWKKIKKTGENLNKNIYCSLNKQWFIHQQLLSFSIATSKIYKKFDFKAKISDRSPSLV